MSRVQASPADTGAGATRRPVGQREERWRWGLTFVALVVSGAALVIADLTLHLFRDLPIWLAVSFSLGLMATVGLGTLVGAALFDAFWRARARGAGLQRRVVTILTVTAFLPGLAAFILSTVVLRATGEEFFVDRITEANSVARNVANGYANAESRKVGVQIFQLATDLAIQAQQGLTPEAAPIGFRRYLLGQAILRDFSAVMVLSGEGEIVTGVTRVSGQQYRLPPAAAFDAVNAEGASPFYFNAHDQETLDAYYALLRMEGTGGYVIAYKDEVPTMSQSLMRVRDFRDQSIDVRVRLEQLFLLFAVGFGLIMMMLLLSAMWFGLLAANRIVNPIRKLSSAAEAVSAGDFSKRVPVDGGDELGDLGRAFNEMTAQLATQRQDLMTTNAQSEARRRFIETVVAGVPAGVLNVARDGRIALANPSARRILTGSAGALTGKNLNYLAPELSDLLARANKDPSGDHRGQAEIEREGVLTIINARIGPDDPERVSGFVITLDDITELVSAQRNAAWGDVARRIAHEIKNPLTPIQLSAERLRRKYAKQITSDHEIFDQCTDTIIRHVNDIGRMVNEFSSFARMPKPVFADEDLADVAKSAAFSFTVAHPDIDFTFSAPPDGATARCDGRLIGQAVVNLVKNASEAIKESDRSTEGRIDVSITEDDRYWKLAVSDNGRGLPAEGRSRLTEPYMTTRAKGTGLGLAIVRKAIEEHGGRFRLIDQGVENGPGATAILLLPKDASLAEAIHGANDEDGAASDGMPVTGPETRPQTRVG